MVVAAAGRSVGVGVRLPTRPGDLGRWLSAAAAYDAAGADALWVDVAPEPELDPLALTAALAAVTGRALLVATVSAAGRPLGEVTRTLATLDRLSRGRLRVIGDATMSAGGRRGVFVRLPGEPEAYDHARADSVRERWVAMPVPDGRASWRVALADAAERGVAGLLVPADPRLIDLLRNPGDPGERRDLQLATG